MISKIKHASISFALSLGSLGGTMFILTNYFFLHGKYMLIPYAIFIIAMIVALKSEPTHSYAQRFANGYCAFIVAALVHYVFVIIDRKVVTVIPLFGHLWRLGFLLLIGAVISLTVARLSDNPRFESTT